MILSRPFPLPETVKKALLPRVSVPRIGLKSGNEKCRDPSSKEMNFLPDFPSPREGLFT